MRKIKNTLLLKYYQKNVYINLSLLTLSSLLYSLCQAVFLTPANLYPSGLVAVAQFLVYVTPISNIWFSVINLALNVPLIIFVWIKYPRKNFVFYTIYFIIFLIFWSLLWNNLSIFKEPNFFDATYTPQGYIAQSDGWIVLLHGVIGGLFGGSAVAFAFMGSGSTGGTDLPVIYVGYKTGRSIGGLSRIFSYSITLLAIVGQAGIDGKNPLTALVGIYAVGSYVYIFVYGITLNAVFPKYRKIKLEISVEDPSCVVKAFETTNYHHAYRIVEVTSGFTKQKRYQVDTVLLYYEKQTFINAILKEDPKAWFSITRVDSTVGFLSRRD